MYWDELNGFSIWICRGLQVWNWSWSNAKRNFLIFLIFTIIYQNIYRIQNIKCPSIPKHELIEEILISINYKINHQVELNNADFVLTQKVSGDRLWEIYFSPVCLSLSHSGWVASVTGDCPECDSQTADRGPNTNLAQSAGVNFPMAWPGLAWPGLPVWHNQHLTSLYVSK